MADDKEKGKQEPEAPAADEKAAKKQKAQRDQKKRDEEKEEKKTPQPKKGDYGPDFRYIVRLSATDLDGTKQVQVALTSIKGIGRRVGRVVSDQAKIDPSALIGNLTEDQVETLQTAIDAAGETLPGWAVNRPRDVDSGDDLHLVGPEVDVMLRDDLNRMKKIRSYRIFINLGPYGDRR